MGDERQTKLFIKVDGVIGPRRRICTFCNGPIKDVEKVVETTRKLRRGPYFPQLAYLQSSIGKIDCLGRAIVCLSCFHQLLRQWNTYENTNVPVQRRIYKHVSDKGVKNYEETRAIEIRKEAEKRAFAIRTNQKHVVKKSFARLTKILDAEEDTINRSEQRIQELNRELKHCTKGEKWKINREIQHQKKTIKAAERRIDEEEDKEEEIRKETKKLFEIYEENNSLFRATSQPNLFNNTEQDIVMTEKDIDCFSKGELANVSRDSGYFDRVDGRNTDQQAMAFDEGYKTTISMGPTTRTRAQSDDFSIQYFVEGTSERYQTTNNGAWDQVKSPKRAINEGSLTIDPLEEEWHLVKEIVYSPKSDSSLTHDDVWPNLSTQESESDSYKRQTLQQDNQVYVNDRWNSENCAAVKNRELVPGKRGAVDERESNWKEAHVYDIEKQQHQTISEYNLVKEVVGPVESFPDDEWSKLFYESEQQMEKREAHEENYKQESYPFTENENIVNDKRSYKSMGEKRATDKTTEQHYPVSQYILVKDVVSPVESFPDDEWSKLFTQNDQQRDKDTSNEVISSRKSYHFSRDEKTDDDEMSYQGLPEDKLARESAKDTKQTYMSNSDSLSPKLQHTKGNLRFEDRRHHEKFPDGNAKIANNSPSYDTLDPWDSIEIEKERGSLQSQPDSYEGAEDDSYNDEYGVDIFSGSHGKEVLSPKRLDKSRLDNFVKSSAKPQPIKTQHSAKKSPGELNYTAQTTQYEPAVTIIEEPNNRVKIQEANISHEPITNSKLLHERHLSVEEEEWERKHLNPRRLDDSKLFSFISERLNDSPENVDQKVTTPATHYKRVDNDGEKNNRGYPKHSNTRHATDLDVEIELPVQRSPASKMMVRQNKITQEQPIKKMDSNGSLQTDPWEYSWPIQSARVLAESGNVADDSPSHNTSGVGRLDLERWKSELERNKMREADVDSDARTDYGVQSPRKFNRHIQRTPVIVEEPRENVSQQKKTTFAQKNDTSSDIIVVQEQGARDENDDDIKKRSIGRIDLSIWEQNHPTHQKLNGQRKAPDKDSDDDNSNLNMVQASMPYNINDGESNKSLNFGRNISRSRPMPRADPSKRSHNSDSAPLKTLENTENISSPRPRFNQSLSEDEIAWEKRFSRTDDKESSDEDSVIQNTANPMEKDANPPRLDDNGNYLVTEKISLDDAEVRRVRKDPESQRFEKSSSAERKATHHQDSTGFPETRPPDISQSSEEEAWEKRRSNPGKLDLSKFSQFT